MKLRLVMMTIMTAAALSASAATFKADDGVTLHYERSGKGAPVVLLSGGPGFSPDYMRPIAAKLSSEFETILFHQRGTGRSSMEKIDSKTHEIKRLTADLEALRRELKLETLTIVAHSWGGILSMFYGTEFPERIGALVLVDSGGPTLQSVPGFAIALDARLTEEERAAVKLWSSAEKVAEDRKRAVLELTRARTGGYFADRAKAKAFAAQLDENSVNDAVFWAIMVQIPLTLDLRPALSAVKAPVLVIHGTEDPLQSAEELHATFAESKLVMLEKAGHFPWLEQPGPFFAALEPFLSEATEAAAPRR